MKNRIHLLPEDVVSQIAAGEVIERSASIVKELLENSIDAGSTSITIRIDRTGYQRIEIIDNGSGMNEEEVTSAFLLHSTSKISHIEDIDHLTTLGFRGEALASIASIADIEVHTKNDSNQPLTYILTNGQKKIIIGPNRNTGTTIKVAKIFHQIPARRKFIKSEETEYRHILQTFINIAIPNHNVEFKLFRDDALIYDLKATGEQGRRITDLFRNIKTKDLMPIFYDEPRIKISGYLGHPELAKSRNSDQYIFLNNRFIKDPLITKAVREGYGTALMHNQYPTFFINLIVDPQLFDVNVHPRKTEVRFVNIGRIFSIISKSVQHTIEKNLYQNMTANFEQKTTVSPSPKVPKFQPNNYNNNSIPESIKFTKNLFSKPFDMFENLPEQQYSENSFQIFNTYIILEKDEKLILIDQHAAHERINFEKFSKQIKEQSRSGKMDLLIPIKINLSDLNISKLTSFKNLLEGMGYAFNINKTKGIEIKTIPQLTEKINQEILIQAILDELDDTVGNTKESIRDIQNKIISTIACHSSIRAGQKISGFQIRDIIKGLFACTMPYSCPHGRPIVQEITRTEIEYMFKRKL